jgi:23S rRNA (pseudouridine1915-N3)-methyltransferase
VQIRIVAVGKVREAYVASACADFLARLRRYHTVDIVEIRPSAATRAEIAMREEGQRILAVAAGGPLWLLDRLGVEISSSELSGELRSLERDGTRAFYLAIGGAFGTDLQVRERSRFVWSLSKLTFLHEWTRAIVLEQLYRAAKIARNEPYHH